MKFGTSKSTDAVTIENAPAFITKWMWKLIAVLVVLLLLQLAIGWYNDYASCQRQVPVRKALVKLSVVERLAVQNTTQVESKKLRLAAANALRVAQVDCIAPLPSVH